MYHNIPMELRELPQWVCWRYEMQGGRKTKVPYSPDGHHKANVNNPATWGTFNDAVSQSMGPTMDGIGMMLTATDPYTGIDIDDKQTSPASEEERRVQRNILEVFASYTERSVGASWVDEQGNTRSGYHIIIKGKINGGRDRNHVGVYSTMRYLTFSGDVVRAAPIGDFQEELLALVAKMPDNGFADELWDIEGILDDGEVHAMAMRAANGDKYDALCKCTSAVYNARDEKVAEGTYVDLGYESQSHADLALLSIFAYYSRDNEQVKRLFRYSGLGRRSKAMQNDKYLNRTLKLIRSHEPDPTDFEQARLNAEAIMNSANEQRQQATPEPMPQQAEPVQAPPQLAAPSSTPPAPVDTPTRAPAPTQGAFTPPPGIVGELARYIYSSTVRPVHEVALVTAIGLVAGVVGRSYNISNTGLNQYILLLARTGSGKEGMAKSISKLFAAVRPQVPMADDFIGPGAFASGQGLIRTLDARPCFVSVLGEFGLTLQAMNDPRAPANMTILRKVLLDIYAKSGWEDVLHSTAYSDLEKNTKHVQAPNVTILGESTPETFYDGISSSDIADGLIPRFHVVEYVGKRPPRNKAAGMPPSAALTKAFADLCGIALTTRQNNTCAAVQIAPDALALMDAFDVECDDGVNDSINAGESQLWNRAHIKVLKLAGLIAVGCNPHAPVVTTEIAEWAIDFTRRGSEQIMSRFNVGDVGSGEGKQGADLRRAIKEYFKHDAKTLQTYKCKPEWQKAGLIPYAYLVVRLSRVASFYNDRQGAARSLRNQLETMVAAEMLGVVTPLEAQAKFKARQALYYLGPLW